MRFTELDDVRVDELEDLLEREDRAHSPAPREGRVSVGLVREGRLLAGADGVLTVCNILYVSTVYVEAGLRRQGVGRALMAEVERRARALGARLLRLDTFDWQGRDFYRALGYEEIGSYADDAQGFSEHFFLKRL